MGSHEINVLLGLRRLYHGYSLLTGLRGSCRVCRIVENSGVATANCL